MTEQNNARPLLQRMNELPPVFDPERVHRLFDELEIFQKNTDDGQFSKQISFLRSDESATKLLTSVAGNSPFLKRQILKYPAFTYQCMTSSPEELLEEVLESIRSGIKSATEMTDAMKILRIGKNQGALLIAFCDIAGVWDVHQVTIALTRLADTCLNAAVCYLLFSFTEKGDFVPKESQDPLIGCGITFIAMGKYGSFELNYSSDIDFTVFYDPDICPVTDKTDAASLAIRLARDTVKLMQESTADGYVFRTDLRLRPDAGSTPVAVSIPAAEHYYESMGQNWERAAMIKARAAVGDREVGQSFLKTLVPFIWRKYLDYAAIEDIHSIKRQIHTHKGYGKLAVPGHNIKLGYGGIREIEFFVQTQQLILGGRFETLRVQKTCEGLDVLQAENMISKNTAEELKHSYEILRCLEHRLQMHEDAQTHTIPEQDEQIENIAYFSGFQSRREFEDFVFLHLNRVHRHYQALFEKEEPLASESGSLVFTGVDDDPQTIQTIQKMGFNRPEQVVETIRGWHFGRVSATRSERSRELLTKLVPRLLAAISKTTEPDLTFVRFTEFLQGLPAGIQLFSLFYSHPEFLDLVVDILGTAPRLAPYMAKNASVFDALLDDQFLTDIPVERELKETLQEQIVEAQDFEEILDTARRFGKDEQFRTGIQLLRGVHTASSAGQEYSLLADILVQTLVPLALADIEAQHGAYQGAEYAIVGMGKFGGCEMTATSDLDMIIVYDFPEDVTSSIGEHAIDGSSYFTRFSRRLIAALSAETAQGSLYEVDMQLRPSGKAGPVATKFESFDRYYRQEAWTWELMALTRARVVAGTPTLTKKVEETICQVLCTERERNELKKDVLDMRDRLVREKSTDNIWDLKQVRGGLIDLEFIMQYLQLVNAHTHPEVLAQNTSVALSKLYAAKCIEGKFEKRLSQGANLLNILNQYTKLCFEGDLRPEEAGTSLKTLLANRANVENFAKLERDLIDAQSSIKDAFDALIV